MTRGLAAVAAAVTAVAAWGCSAKPASPLVEASGRAIRFTDVTPAQLPPGLPVASENPDSEIASTALFEDVDGDGSPELFVSASVGGGVYGYAEGRWQPKQSLEWLPGSPVLAVADVDEDGR